MHLSQHEGMPDEATECSLDHPGQHMEWGPAFGDRVVAYVMRRDLAQQVNGTGLRLTDQGREVAQSVMLR